MKETDSEGRGLREERMTETAREQESREGGRGGGGRE